MGNAVVIIVEGTDDQHALASLLVRNSVQLSKPGPQPEKVHLKCGNSLTEGTGADAVIDNIAAEIKASGGNTVGFILDSDPGIGLKSRWDSIKHQLHQVEIDAPAQPPSEGFIGYSKKTKCWAGVWLMPDNETDGTLETLLSTLIGEGDLLIDHAKFVTEAAAQIDRRFGESDFVKAHLHTWLAWQPRPGCPYGMAITAKFFGATSPTADRFVAWVRELLLREGTTE